MAKCIHCHQETSPNVCPHCGEPSPARLIENPWETAGYIILLAGIIIGSIIGAGRGPFGMVEGAFVGAVFVVLAMLGLLLVAFAGIAIIGLGALIYVLIDKFIPLLWPPKRKAPPMPNREGA